MLQSKYQPPPILNSTDYVNELKYRNFPRARTILSEARPFFVDLSEEERFQLLSRIRSQRKPVKKETRSRQSSQNRQASQSKPRKAKQPKDPAALAKQLVKGMSIEEQLALIQSLKAAQ